MTTKTLFPTPKPQEQDFIVTAYLTELKHLFARYARDHQTESRNEHTHRTLQPH